MRLQAPEKVQKLQQTLHAKAKESPDCRFYALYDKLYREDILAHAYQVAGHNGGKPGVDGDDRRGGWRRTTRAKDSKSGIPQGAPISPLLSNLYMRRFLLGWKTLGLEDRFQARIVNFADDCAPGNVCTR